jgi:uncharacterized protein YacL
MRVSANFLARIVGMIVLAFFGTWIGFTLSGSTVNEGERLAIQLLTLAGAGLGLLTAHRVTVEPAARLQRTLNAMTLDELLASGAGLLFGALFGRLFSYPLSLLPGLLSRHLPTLVMLLCAYLGLLLARRHRRELTELVGGLLRRRRPLGEESAASEPSARRFLVDTSAVIDGRIAGVAQTGFLEGVLVVPTFVLNELQMLADSSDELRRTRGRRGLDILNQMRKESVLPVEVVDADTDGALPVDDKLVLLARRFHCPIITNDFNLNKVAELQGVRVLSLNALSDAVRAPVVPGQMLQVVIRSEGREREQGISFLDDGTMIVVEDARHLLGHGVAAVVTRIYQTTSGRIIFAHLAGSREEREKVTR